MIAACYSMDIYCDDERHQAWHEGHMAQFTGEAWADCARKAKAAGWKFNRRTGKSLCKKHRTDKPKAQS